MSIMGPFAGGSQVGGVILGGSALLRACGRTHFGARDLISKIGRAVEDGIVMDDDQARGEEGTVLVGFASSGIFSR